MAGEVIPFGKYKGQPVEVVVQDRQYVEWLTAQPWFRERFANIHTLIVNNFQEPTETPVHNALQARFLDPAFRARFFEVVRANAVAGAPAAVEFEVEGFDVQVVGKIHAINHYESGPREVIESASLFVEIKPTVADDYPAVLRQIKDARQRPRILKMDYCRQVQENVTRDAVLLLEEYTGSGATCEQFIEIFEASGIKVVFLDEIA